MRVGRSLSMWMKMVNYVAWRREKEAGRRPSGNPSSQETESAISAVRPGT